MPIVSSAIIENKPYGENRRSIIEEHIDTNGKKYHVDYITAPNQDINQELINRIQTLNQTIIDTELNNYIGLIERGDDIFDQIYETSTQTRALYFLNWVKAQIEEKNYKALKYVPAIIDEYTVEQINMLTGENIGDQVKLMVEKIRTIKSLEMEIDI